MFVSRMGKSGEVFYEERDMPKADGEKVLIKMKAIAICGSDKHMYLDGTMDGQIWGHEYSGIVFDPGSRKDLTAGDRVAIFPVEPCGTCEFCKAGRENLCPQVFRGAGGADGAAEYQLVSPSMPVKFSENISFVEGALVEPTAVVYHALKRAAAGKGDALLISGVGSLTGLLAEVARAVGVEIIVITDSSYPRAEPLLKSGVVDGFVNCDEPGSYTKLMDLAEKPFGYDICIDIKGGAKTVNDNLVCLRNGGTAVLVAEVPGDKEPLNLYDLTEDEKDIKGSYCYTVDEFKEVIQMMEDKRIDVTKYVGKTFKLSQCKEAFAYSFDRGVLPSKIILKP